MSDHIVPVWVDGIAMLWVLTFMVINMGGIALGVWGVEHWTYNAALAGMLVMMASVAITAWENNE